MFNWENNIKRILYLILYMNGINKNNRWRCTAISELLINEQIRAREVRLVGEDGEQLGIVSINTALERRKLPIRI